MPEKNQSAFLDNDPSDSNLNDTATVLYYWHAALRYKLAMIGIVAACVALGFILTLMTTPYYTSTARVEINRELDNVTNVETVSGSENAAQNFEFYKTQYTLLESRSLAERVVRAKNLVSNEKFLDAFDIDNNIIGDFRAVKKVISSAERSERFKLATKILLDHVDISPISESSLVDINFESPNSALSAEISNAWVEEFIAYNLDRRFNATSDAREFLEGKLSELKQRLEDSERKLAAYADDKEIITLSSGQTSEGKTVSQKTLASTNLETLNSALAQATADRISAQSEIKQRSGNRNALENTTLNNLRGERAKAKAEYAQLMTQFEPGYPAAMALASKISAFDASILSEEARSRAGTNARFREALDQEQKLRQQVSQLKNDFRGERNDSIQYNIYQREVDTNRQLYDGLLQRFKEIGVAGVSTNNITLVDRAEPSARPSSPILILNTLLSIFTGLVLAAGYVLVAEQVDLTIKDPSELKAKVGIASLGSIPDFERDDVLASLNDKKSVAWEAYFSIRTNLTFLTDHGAPRSFLLTSTRPNEGKSTSVLALATILASTKKRILIVDGDMRNPSLHGMLGEKNDRGLSNYLAGDDDLDQLIHRGNDGGFDAMSAGPIPPNAAELLSSSRMQELIAKLTDEYDTVIVDGPPVLGFADIPLLANAVEGVIYTIEVGGARLSDIQSSIQRIRGAHAHIFGGIMTKVQSKSSGYGENYTYQYSYGGKPIDQL